MNQSRRIIYTKKRENKYLPNGIKFKSHLRNGLIIFSVIGFVFQSIQLFEVYFSGQTVPVIRVERLQRSKFPAITLCFPTFLSFEKFSETYPEYSEVYSLQSRVISTNNYSEKNKRILNWIFKHYERAYRSKHKNITLDLIFRNLSIQHLVFSSTDISHYDHNYQLVWNHNPSVIRSIIPTIYPKICFTMLSALGENYTDHPVKVRQIGIKIRHRNEDYSHLMFYANPVYLTVHSPNIIPDFDYHDNFVEIRNGRETFVTYTEVVTKRLPPPYQSSCKDYKEKTSKNLRSDCITKCINDAIIEVCGIDCISSKDNIKPLVEGVSDKYLNMYICDHDQFNQSLLDCVGWKRVYFESICEEKCPKNCEEIHYDFHITHIDNIEPNWDTIAIFVAHKNAPDTTHEYVPIMFWIDLVSSFGGLLGMWLGLSVIFIINYFAKLLGI